MSNVTELYVESEYPKGSQNLLEEIRIKFLARMKDSNPSDESNDFTTLTNCLTEHGFEYTIVPYSFPTDLPMENFKQIKVQTTDNPRNYLQCGFDKNNKFTGLEMESSNF